MGSEDPLRACLRSNTCRKIGSNKEHSSCAMQGNRERLILLTSRINMRSCDFKWDAARIPSNKFLDVFVEILLVVANAVPMDLRWQTEWHANSKVAWDCGDPPTTQSLHRALHI